MRLLTVPSGRPGDLADLLVAQLFHVAQHEALAEARLELAKMARCTMCSTCLPAIISSGRSICPTLACRACPSGTRSDGLELVLLARVPHAQVLAAVLAEVDRDSVDPRRELRLAAERADRLEDLDEDLLREVLRLGAVADHPQTSAKTRRS
jgi:hypothetical protein